MSYPAEDEDYETMEQMMGDRTFAPSEPEPPADAGYTPRRYTPSGPPSMMPPPEPPPLPPEREAAPPEPPPPPPMVSQIDPISNFMEAPEPPAYPDAPAPQIMDPPAAPPPPGFG